MGEYRGGGNVCGVGWIWVWVGAGDGTDGGGEGIGECWRGVGWEDVCMVLFFSPLLLLFQGARGVNGEERVI